MRKAFVKISVYIVLVVGLLLLTYFFLRNENSFSVYVIAFLTFIGWLLAFFAIGAGFVILPFEYIWSWIIRPRPLKKAEFEVQK